MVQQNTDVSYMEIEMYGKKESGTVSTIEIRHL